MADRTLTWASALAMAGGLLVVAGGVFLVPIYEGVRLPLGVGTDAIERQLHDTGPPILFVGWALASGGLAILAGHAMRGLEPDEAVGPAVGAIVAGLLALGPGGGFLWGTVLSVLGGCLALAAS